MKLLDMNERPGYHVLIVDDSHADCQLMRLWLRDSKAVRQISSVMNGHKALQMLRREREFADFSLPDLILLDVNLPDMDGLEVLGEIQRDPQLQSIPVFVLSGTYFEEDARSAIRLGARRFLVKPFDADEFTSVLQAIEDEWSGSGRTPEASP